MTNDIAAPSAADAQSQPVARRVGRPPGSSRDLTSTRIVSSALKLFTEKGYAGTTYKDVARGAGITSPAIYQYFGSKSELYGAALESIYGQLMPEIQGAVATGETLRDQLGAMLRVLLELHEKTPDYTAFLSAVPFECSRQEDLKEHFAQRESRLLAALHSLFEDAKMRGEIAPERSTDSLVMVFLGSVVGMALYQQGSPGVSMRSAFDAFSDIIDSKLFVDS